MSKFRTSLQTSFLCLALAACGGGTDLNSIVVYSDVKTISEGQQLSVVLSPGTYKADISSSNHGVVVSWAGGNCLASNETKAISVTCTLTIKGQLLILNPTTFGLGGDEITTIKVTNN